MWDFYFESIVNGKRLSGKSNLVLICKNMIIMVKMII